MRCPSSFIMTSLVLPPTSSVVLYELFSPPGQAHVSPFLYHHMLPEAPSKMPGFGAFNYGGHAQQSSGLLLALCSGITPYSTWGGARDWTEVSCIQSKQPKVLTWVLLPPGSTLWILPWSFTHYSSIASPLPQGIVSCYCVSLPHIGQGSPAVSCTK